MPPFKEVHLICWISEHIPYSGIYDYSENCTYSSHDNVQETWNLNRLKV